MEIRAASPVEAPGLAAMLAEAGVVLDPNTIVERLAAIHASSSTALVALQWGPPSGLVVLHWHPTILAARPVALITTLLVAEEDRRKGVGRMLIKAAAQAARSAGCGDMEILVHSKDPTLPAFCSATGFELTGSRYVRPLRKRPAD